MKPLEGKVAIVLGVSSKGNIGLSIAIRFIELGATVVVAGRNHQDVDSAAGVIGARAMRCDITDETDLRALSEAVQNEHGRIDIAVNAVGTNLVSPFLEVTKADLDAVIATQLVGTFLFLQTMVKAMSSGGAIIQISSVTANSLLADHAAYMATKAAGDVLVKSAAFDFGHRGIRVNSLSPSATLDAPMAAPFMRDPAVRDDIASLVPLGRIGTMRDVANAAAWLAGDECFVTGENIQVNGGTAIPALQKPPRA